MADKIFIRDLVLRCIIGTRSGEREKKQEVVINITLECDLAPAGKSDRLDDTANYTSLANSIAVFVEGSTFFLVEKLAHEIAGICLQNDRTTGVTVTVDKPGALPASRSVAVKIKRGKI